MKAAVLDVLTKNTREKTSPHRETTAAAAVRQRAKR